MRESADGGGVVQIHRSSTSWQKSTSHRLSQTEARRVSIWNPVPLWIIFGDRWRWFSNPDTAGVEAFAYLCASLSPYVIGGSVGNILTATGIVQI
ncbi:hypothetical protein ABZP36_031760 [Zizania latifolia]